MRITAVGIAWYHENDYDHLRETFDDGEKLHSNYREWLQAANGGLERLRSEGKNVEKVYIIPKEFAAWCKAKGKKAQRRGTDEFCKRSCWPKAS